MGAECSLGWFIKTNTNRFIRATKKLATSLNATFPILVVIKYSSLHSVFFSVKSKVKPPVVISGAPKNFTTLPTAAEKHSNSLEETAKLFRSL